MFSKKAGSGSIKITNTQPKGRGEVGARVTVKKGGIIRGKVAKVKGSNV